MGTGMKIVIGDKPAGMGSKKSLGQSFLKDCGCREGKALRLHPLPILTLFHCFRNVPVHIVPRSGTQNIVQKEKVTVSGMR